MLSTLTRRRLVTSGAAVAIAPLFGAASPGSQAITTVKECTAVHKGDYKLSYYQHSDHRHTKLLSKHFHGLLQDPVFQKLAPLSMVVVHRKGPPVVAFTANWSVTTVNGTFPNVLFHYGKPGSHLSTHGKVPLISGKRHVIKRRGVVLITPFFSWSAGQYKLLAAEGFSWNAVITRREPGSFLLHQLTAGADIAIGLDGAVFSDHRMIGDNKLGLAAHFKARRHGEHDLAVGVHQLLRKGATPADVQAFLLEKANMTRPSGTYKQVCYGLSQRFYAAKLYSLAERKGEEKLGKAARHAAREARTMIVGV